jgi:type II secretion system protein I
MRNSGFTFIEVLIAMLIFTMAVLAAVDIARGSVRATNDSKEITLATWLVQSKMVDLETKLENEGVDKACDEKIDGKFEAPYERFTWRTQCYPIDFRISEAAAALANPGKDKDGENVTTENPILKMVLDLASSHISQSMRELHVKVMWTEGKNPREVSLSTHFARYDLNPSIPGLGGGTSTAPAGGTTPTPGTNN